ncbi:MAG: hypothetical protein DMG99_07725 [Acidobacteria bacterium]|nr:MAG: hypothetical protein DMG99_07725 [Acidobacteriota bacterium]
MDCARARSDGPWWHSRGSGGRSACKCMINRNRIANQPRRSRRSERGFTMDIRGRLSLHQVTSLHARIQAPPGNSSMSDARQQAEDHYYAALDLMAEGQLEQAVARYREALLSDPTFTEAMHGLARALQDLQRYDEAIEVAQKIAEVDPDDVLAHTSLSVLYQKKGMIPEAEAEGAKARVLGWKQQLKQGGG